MENQHPVATRRALLAYCFAIVVGGGVAAGLTSGLVAALAVAGMALIGGGGAAWLTWPRKSRG